MGRSKKKAGKGIRNVVLYYGIGLAVLVFLLKYVEYRFLVKDLSMEFYIGVVAILFTGMGIWVGTKLLHGKRNEESQHQPNVPDQAAIESLSISARELEVLQLMAKGNSNQEIADALFISLPTVKSHSSNLFGKLDVRRRTQAVHKAKSLGILP